MTSIDLQLLILKTHKTLPIFSSFSSFNAPGRTDELKVPFLSFLFITGILKFTGCEDPNFNVFAAILELVS